MCEENDFAPVGRRSCAGRPPQQRLHLGFEDLELEGLGQVVIGTGRVPGECVWRGAQLGEHQDRNAGCAVIAPQSRGKLDAVQLWHPHISDHQVRDLVAYELKRFDPIACVAHAKAPPLQKTANHLLDHAVVVDQDDVFVCHYFAWVSL